MKETNKATRIFGIALIVSNFLFLAFRGIRIIMHQQMIFNNNIYEATLHKLVTLDTMGNMMKYIIAMIALLTILFLIEELLHATLQKDCMILFMASLVCTLASLMTVVFLKQPIELLQEHLSFLPYFLASLGAIEVINHMKKRYVHQMQQV